MNDKMIKTNPMAANTKLSTPRLFFDVIFLQIEMYFNVSESHGFSNSHEWIWF